MQKTKEKSKHSIRTMCKVLSISEAGYYQWLKKRSKPNKYDELLAKIRQIRADNPDYGAYRIYLDLKLNHNYKGSYYVILTLCKKYHLMLKKKHRPKGLTKANPAAQASENLIQQDFTASSPNKFWPRKQKITGGIFKTCYYRCSTRI